jgi:hypothetical protein
VNVTVFGWLRDGVIVAAIIAYLIWQLRRDKADEVVAAFADLRLTPTHILAGHLTRRRYPASGARAVAEDSGRRSVYLTVTTSHGSLVREVPFKNHPRAGVEARAFAVRINARST